MRKTPLILLLLSLLFLFPTLVSADNTLQVYYAGKSDSLFTALSLDKNLQLVTYISQAEVIILSGEIPDGGAIQARVEQGAGLVFILGPDLNAAEINALLGENSGVVYQENPLSLNTPSPHTDPIQNNIIWTSAPQVRQRYLVSGSSFTPLVTGFDDGSMVLGRKNLGSGQVFIFTAFLNSDNPQFQEWAYFDYLM